MDMTRKEDANFGGDNQSLQEFMAGMESRLASLEESVRLPTEVMASVEASLARTRETFRVALMASVAVNFLRRLYKQLFPDDEIPFAPDLTSIERKLGQNEQMKRDSISTLYSIVPQTDIASYHRILRYTIDKARGMSHPTILYRVAADEESEPPTPSKLREEVYSYFSDAQSRVCMENIVYWLVQLVQDQDGSLENLLTNELR